MSKVGSCHIMVGPHLFDAMLYTVKDPNAPPPIQYTPPQRPMVHYGHPNHFQQYQPYSPHPPQAIPPQQVQPIRQAPPPSAHSGPPQQGYQPRNQQSMRPPSNQGRGPNNATPNPPATTPGPQQRPPPSQPAQPQPAKPSPDPVIQMLATRAASDPELKALMRVVASTEATQEQLRAFQSHIDELNAIIRAREQRQQQRQQVQQPVAPSPQPTPVPGPPATRAPPPPQDPPQQSPQQPSQQSQTPQSNPQTMSRVDVQVPRYSPATNTPSQQPNSQPQTPVPSNPNTTPQLKQEPGVATPIQPPASTPTPGPNAGIAPGPPPPTGPHSNAKPLSPAVRPVSQPPQQSAGPRPGPPYPPYQQPYQQTPPIHSRPPQYGSPAYYRPAPPPQPRMNYKSVVLEFTSPLTPYGSSTSGHAGSGDRYLFPEHTILEWLPGGTAVLASFLLVRKVDPSQPFPLETATEIANSRAKGKSNSKSKKSDKKKKAEDDKAKEDEKANGQGNQPGTPANPEQATTAGHDAKPPGTEQPKASDTANEQGDKTDIKSEEPQKENPANLKEYYQPVTFHFQSPNPKVLEPLARVVKPPDEVRRYMNEVMDRAERAPDGFLAMRLPREGVDQSHLQDNEGGKKATTTGHRSRPSRGNKVALLERDDTDAENSNTMGEDGEEKEELADFYGAPTGIGFW